MAASNLRPASSISFLCFSFVRLLQGVTTWAALVSATGSGKADNVRFQPRLQPGYENSQCLRLSEESKMLGVIPLMAPVDIRGTLSDTEDL